MTSADESVQSSQTGPFSGLLVQGADGHYYFLPDGLQIRTPKITVDFIIPPECADVADQFFNSGTLCYAVRTSFIDPYNNGGIIPVIDPLDVSLQSSGRLVKDTSFENRIIFIPDNEQIDQNIQIQGSSNIAQATRDMASLPHIEAAYATIPVCSPSQSCDNCLPASALTCVGTATGTTVS
jgi:hypothetical protein